MSTVLGEFQSVVQMYRIAPHISEFHQRVKVGKSAGKVRIAVIRKVLVSAYNMLKKNETCFWINKELYTSKLKEYHKTLKRIARKREEERKIA